MPASNNTNITKVAEAMKDMDFCMFTTVADDGGLRSRPMSNNGEVEFDGDVWFFTAADSRKVAEIRRQPTVHLAFAESKQMRFVSMSGAAELVDDVEKKEELWIKDLERWFPGGPSDSEVLLIKVTPVEVGIWDKEEESQITLSERADRD